MSANEPLSSGRQEMSESLPHWVEPSAEGESRLALDFIPAARKDSRLWVFLHGLSSNRRGEKAVYFARQIARRGEAFASLDMTGHGDSEGEMLELSLSRNLRDLERGLRHVEEQHGPFAAVHLIGSSMGGLTALWFSAQKPGIVTRNLVIAPAFEMAGRLMLSLGRARAQKWRREGKIHLDIGYGVLELGYGLVEDESRYPTISLVRKLKTPSLILHGSDDAVVPCQLSRSFAERVEGVELIEVAGGDHRLTANKEALFEEMWRFVGPNAPM